MIHPNKSARILAIQAALDELPLIVPLKRAAFSAVFLTPQQRVILKLVLNRQSVFITGGAGTGKTTLTQTIIKDLRVVYKDQPGSLAVTASTADAAALLGGTTVQAFAGVDLSSGEPKALAARIRKSRSLVQRWRNVKTLVVDDISFLDGQCFDTFEAVARAVRFTDKHFGGIQLVLAGDFFQSGTTKTLFTFEATSWHMCIQHTFVLDKVFRQRESVLVDILEQFRLGRVSSESECRFRELARSVRYLDGVPATKLLSDRSNVSTINTEALSSISSMQYTFSAIDSSPLDITIQGLMFDSMLAVRTLHLKVGADVILIRHIDNSLSTGASGRVVDFVDEGPVVEFLMFDGTTRRETISLYKWTLSHDTVSHASRLQIPLLPACSAAVCKVRGYTLDRVNVDFSKIANHGQAYLALSRATSMDTLEVFNFDSARFKPDPKVVAWYDTMV